MNTSSFQSFFSHFAQALEQGDAAIFAGAGLSRPTGYADWRELLRNVASDLGLDVDRESDLVAVAQYHLNTRASRAQLNRLLIDEFTKDARPTRSHALIASMPIRTIWTTNYDTLIEDAFRAAGKRADVKTTVENLATTLPRRDVTIYKMHGDIGQPHQAVLTKEDYETYDSKRELFSTALKGDLIAKTFLFLGFSFADPNIDYILSRVRSLLGQNQREHYCIMRQIPKPSGGGGLAQYEYEKRKQDLRIADLRRYSIQALLIDEYSQVEEILSTLARLSRSRNIFISGSAQEFGVMSRERLEGLARILGAEIIQRGYNLVSGLGLGIGAAVLVGAMERIYQDERATVAERAYLHPFPGPSTPDSADRYRRYREEMLNKSGFAIFLAGNREDPTTGRIIPASGVLEEFRIAGARGVFPIPIGASGYAAQQVWQEVFESLEKYFPNLDVAEQFQILASPDSTNEAIVEAVFEIIRRARTASTILP